MTFDIPPQTMFWLLKSYRKQAFPEYDYMRGTDMAKLSGKHQKIKAFLDDMGQQVRAGKKFHSNQDFERPIKDMGYSYKQAEGLVMKLGDSDVRHAYIKSWPGPLPAELKQYE